MLDDRKQAGASLKHWHIDNIQVQVVQVIVAVAQSIAHQMCLNDSQVRSVVIASLASLGYLQCNSRL